MKKPIDIYLSGGGIKCAYQITLLEKLINDKWFCDHFTIRNIYCVSFGCFVGYALIMDNLQLLKKLFLAFDDNTLTKTFQLWGIHIPIIGKIINFISKIIWILYGFFNKGYYTSTIGYKLIKALTNKSNESNIPKLNCYVFNVSKNKLELINGMDKYFPDYVIASCSCWGLFKPIFINGSEYIDGGIIQVHPFVNLEQGGFGFGFGSGSSLETSPGFGSSPNPTQPIRLLLSTTNLDNLNNIKLDTGTNILEYMSNLISFLIDKNMFQISRLWYGPNNIIVNYDPPIKLPHIINNDKIKQMFADGEVLGAQVLTQLKSKLL